MSYSRNLTRFYINISVLATRLIGWLQTGDLQKSKGESLKAKILTDYFAHHYLSAVEMSEQKEITVETPETIWQFWDQPAGKKTPEIVKSSLESVRKFTGDFEHKILNNTTFENETDLPGYVLDKFKKGRIDYTHFSDLLRLNLLKNHGGIWLDATGYMTDLLPKYILDEDFFVFLTDETSTFPYSFVQNCFIRAKKGSFLCDVWYQMCVEFWKNETKTLDYFQHQLIFKTLIFNHPDAKILFDKMPHHSERETHQLIGKLLQKFDATEWERIQKASFFQKTTYKIASGTDDPSTYFSKLCGKR
ncbi:MAG: capsular polysaccharide synthesis protein [Dysgonamonadaceae bacterium]|jgi:hypothetical protein|nr:capsular polysaccharide synthesis protein [Dysgonamonadaceae bacterium]